VPTSYFPGVADTANAATFSEASKNHGRDSAFAGNPLTGGFKGCPPRTDRLHMAPGDGAPG